MHVLGGGHLEVIAARDRQVELDVLRKPRQHRRYMGPEERSKRIAPLRSLPEDLVQPLFLLDAVTPTLGFDTDLATQSECMDAPPTGLCHPQPHHKRRHSG